MKTSNKLLITGFFFFIVATIIVLTLFKNNMNIVKSELESDGSGVIITKVLADTVSTSDFHFSSSMTYRLDPDADNVTITADDNLIDQYRISQKTNLFFFTEGDINFEPSKTPVVTIGIKGKEALDIKLRNWANLKSESVIMADLTIDAEDRSQINLDVANSNTTLTLENRVSTSIAGSTDKLTISAEDNSSLKLLDLKMSVFHANIKDRVILYADYAESVLFELEDYAQIHLNKRWKEGSLRRDNKAARVIVDTKEVDVKINQG